MHHVAVLHRPAHHVPVPRHDRRVFAPLRRLHGQAGHRCRIVLPDLRAVDPDLHVFVLAHVPQLQRDLFLLLLFQVLQLIGNCLHPGLLLVFAYFVPFRAVVLFVSYPIG